MEKLKGKIVKIETYQSRGTYIKQGIKGSDQYKYDSHPGGNGTYVTGGEYYGTRLIVKVFIYDLEQCFSFNVYDDIKMITGNSRISSQLLSTIESHEGDKIDVFVDNCSVNFDPRVLLL